MATEKFFNCSYVPGFPCLWFVANFCADGPKHLANGCDLRPAFWYPRLTSQTHWVLQSNLNVTPCANVVLPTLQLAAGESEAKTVCASRCCVGFHRCRQQM